jgi:hypothetical protein
MSSTWPDGEEFDESGFDEGDETDEGDEGEVEGDGPSGALGAKADEVLELSQREGPWQALAAELVALRSERAEKAQAQKSEADAAAVIEAGGEPDWTDEGFLDGLREQVLRSRVSAEARVSAMRRNKLLAEMGPVLGQSHFETEQAFAAVDGSWFGAGVDPLTEHPLYKAHALEVLAQKRQQDVLYRLSERTIVDEGREAAEEIRQFAKDAFDG